LHYAIQHKILTKKILPLLLDDLERAIDLKGNIVGIDMSNVQKSRIKANQPLREEKEEINNNNNNNADDDDSVSFDERIPLKPPTRKRRNHAFQFIQQGAIVKKAYSLRAKALSEDLASIKDRQRIDIKEAAKADEEGLEWLDPVPNVEWWDAKLLNDPLTYSSNYKMSMITDLIENPIFFRAELLNEESCIDRMYLTQHEKRKIRRISRKQKHEQMTDEIRLGLREPPEPRLKLSNIMRVLGTAAIQDPSAAEAKARAQMEKRKMKHLLHNAERQLTPMQKREKKRKKIE